MSTSDTADKCIDGTSLDAQNFCETLATDPNPWLQLDLGVAKSVGMLKIYSTSALFASHEIWVGDSNITTGSGNRRCFTSAGRKFVSGAGEPCRGFGRYVYVTLHKYDVIMGNRIKLQEVEVFADVRKWGCAKSTAHKGLANENMRWYRKSGPTCTLHADAIAPVDAGIQGLSACFFKEATELKNLNVEHNKQEVTLTLATYDISSSYYYSKSPHSALLFDTGVPIRLQELTFPGLMIPKKFLNKGDVLSFSEDEFLSPTMVWKNATKYILKMPKSKFGTTSMSWDAGITARFWRITHVNFDHSEYPFSDSFKFWVLGKTAILDTNRNQRHYAVQVKEETQLVFVNERVRYTEALAHCKAMGGSLVKVSSREIQDAIAENCGGEGLPCWVGGFAPNWQVFSSLQIDSFASCGSYKFRKKFCDKREPLCIENVNGYKQGYCVAALADCKLDTDCPNTLPMCYDSDRFPFGTCGAYGTYSTRYGPSRALWESLSSKIIAATNTFNIRPFVHVVNGSEKFTYHSFILEKGNYAYMKFIRDKEECPNTVDKGDKANRVAEVRMRLVCGKETSAVINILNTCVTEVTVVDPVVCNVDFSVLNADHSDGLTKTRARNNSYAYDRVGAYYPFVCQIIAKGGNTTCETHDMQKQSQYSGPCPSNCNCTHGTIECDGDPVQKQSRKNTDILEIDGGGWIPCYTTNDKVLVNVEVDSNIPFGNNGFRNDCRNIPFNEVLYYDHSTRRSAWFSNDNPAQSLTMSQMNFNGNAKTVFSGHGIAQNGTQKYQLLTCGFTPGTYGHVQGLHISGFDEFHPCWKTCSDWCDDSWSKHFRASAFGQRYVRGGVAFHENGLAVTTNKLMSVLVRLRWKRVFKKVVSFGSKNFSNPSPFLVKVTKNNIKCPSLVNRTNWLNGNSLDEFSLETEADANGTEQKITVTKLLSSQTTDSLPFSTEGLSTWFRSEDITIGDAIWTSNPGGFTAHRTGSRFGSVLGSKEEGMNGKFMKGDALSEYTFGPAVPEVFTMCSLTRFAGKVRGQILSGKLNNFAHGHVNGQVGMVMYNGVLSQANKVKNEGNEWAAVCSTNEPESESPVVVNGVRVSSIVMKNQKNEHPTLCVNCNQKSTAYENMRPTDFKETESLGSKPEAVVFSAYFDSTCKAFSVPGPPQSGTPPVDTCVDLCKLHRDWCGAVVTHMPGLFNRTQLMAQSCLLCPKTFQNFYGWPEGAPFYKTSTSARGSVTTQLQPPDFSELEPGQNLDDNLSLGCHAKKTLFYEPPEGSFLGHPKETPSVTITEKKCADEGQECFCIGVVYYGQSTADGSGAFLSRYTNQLSPSIMCNSQTFGGKPPGLLKNACYCRFEIHSHANIVNSKVPDFDSGLINRFAKTYFDTKCAGDKIDIDTGSSGEQNGGIEACIKICERWDNECVMVSNHNNRCEYFVSVSTAPKQGSVCYKIRTTPMKCFQTIGVLFSANFDNVGTANVTKTPADCETRCAKVGSACKGYEWEGSQGRCLLWNKQYRNRHFWRYKYEKAEGIYSVKGAPFISKTCVAAEDNKVPDSLWGGDTQAEWQFLPGLACTEKFDFSSAVSYNSQKNKPSTISEVLKTCLSDSNCRAVSCEGGRFDTCYIVSLQEPLLQKSSLPSSSTSVDYSHCWIRKYGAFTGGYAKDRNDCYRRNSAKGCKLSIFNDQECLCSLSDLNITKNSQQNCNSSSLPVVAVVNNQVSDWEIADVMIWDKPLSATEMVEVTNYLTQKMYPNSWEFNLTVECEETCAEVQFSKRSDHSSVSPLLECPGYNLTNTKDTAKLFEGNASTTCCLSQTASVVAPTPTNASKLAQSTTVKKHFSICTDIGAEATESIKVTSIDRAKNIHLSRHGSGFDVSVTISEVGVVPRFKDVLRLASDNERMEVEDKSSFAKATRLCRTPLPAEYTVRTKEVDLQAALQTVTCEDQCALWKSQGFMGLGYKLKCEKESSHIDSSLRILETEASNFGLQQTAEKYVKSQLASYSYEILKPVFNQVDLFHFNKTQDIWDTEEYLNMLFRCDQKMVAYDPVCDCKVNTNKQCSDPPPVSFAPADQRTDVNYCVSDPRHCSRGNRDTSHDDAFFACVQAENITDPPSMGSCVSFYEKHESADQGQQQTKSSWFSCQESCFNSAECSFFTWNSQNSDCFLYPNINGTQKNQTGFVSGPKFCPEMSGEMREDTGAELECCYGEEKDYNLAKRRCASEDDCVGIMWAYKTSEFWLCATKPDNFNLALQKIDKYRIHLKYPMKMRSPQYPPFQDYNGCETEKRKYLATFEGEPEGCFREPVISHQLSPKFDDSSLCRIQHDPGSVMYKIEWEYSHFGKPLPIMSSSQIFTTTLPMSNNGTKLEEYAHAENIFGSSLSVEHWLHKGTIDEFNELLPDYILQYNENSLLARPVPYHRHPLTNKPVSQPQPYEEFNTQTWSALNLKDCSASSFSAVKFGKSDPVTGAQLKPVLLDSLGQEDTEQSSSTFIYAVKSDPKVELKVLKDRIFLAGAYGQSVLSLDHMLATFDTVPEKDCKEVNIQLSVKLGHCNGTVGVKLMWGEERTLLDYELGAVCKQSNNTVGFVQPGLVEANFSLSNDQFYDKQDEYGRKMAALSCRNLIEPRLYFVLNDGYSPFIIHLVTDADTDQKIHQRAKTEVNTTSVEYIEAGRKSMLFIVGIPIILFLTLLVALNGYMNADREVEEEQGMKPHVVKKLCWFFSDLVSGHACRKTIKRNRAPRVKNYFLNANRFRCRRHGVYLMYVITAQTIKAVLLTLAGIYAIWYSLNSANLHQLRDSGLMVKDIRDSGVKLAVELDRFRHDEMQRQYEELKKQENACSGMLNGYRQYVRDTMDKATLQNHKDQKDCDYKALKKNSQHSAQKDAAQTMEKFCGKVKAVNSVVASMTKKANELLNGLPWDKAKKMCRVYNKFTGIFPTTTDINWIDWKFHGYWDRCYPPPKNEHDQTDSGICDVGPNNYTEMDELTCPNITSLFDPNDAEPELEEVIEAVKSDKLKVLTKVIGGALRTYEKTPVVDVPPIGWADFRRIWEQFKALLSLFSLIVILDAMWSLKKLFTVLVKSTKAFKGEKIIRQVRCYVEGLVVEECKLGDSDKLEKVTVRKCVIYDPKKISKKMYKPGLYGWFLRLMNAFRRDEMRVKKHWSSLFADKKWIFRVTCCLVAIGVVSSIKAICAELLSMETFVYFGGIDMMVLPFSLKVATANNAIVQNSAVVNLYQLKASSEVNEQERNLLIEQVRQNENREDSLTQKDTCIYGYMDI